MNTRVPERKKETAELQAAVTQESRSPRGGVSRKIEKTARIPPIGLRIINAITYIRVIMELSFERFRHRASLRNPVISFLLYTNLIFAIQHELEISM